MPGGSDLGTGAAIAMSTEGWTGEITDLNWNGIEFAPVEKTHHGSTQPSGNNQVGGQEFIPNVLGDAGTLDVEVNYDPSDPPPLGVVDTITLTFKLKSGDSTPATVSGQGFFTTKSTAIPVKDGMVKSSLSMKLSGVWTITPAT